jgi:ubiquilin
LKDEDTLSTYKIQATHTIHMVKGVSKSAAPATSSTPQALPNMQAGQNVHDPLTQLNSHMGFGAMAGINPFGEMGLNPNDPNMMQSMMNSPQFLQQMSSMLSNPAVLDSIIASNPQLAAMGPQVREVFQSEHFRDLISNPERMQQMMQMSQALRNMGALSGGSPFGAPFGGAAAGGFPAPGNPSTARSTDSNTTQTPTPSTNTTAPAFPNLFAPPAGNTGGASANPMGGMDPALLSMLFGGGFGGAGGGFGALGGGAPAAPADTRPPEVRFETQLQQLQDMGFTNASQNIRALQATGGNVHSAIEYILSGGGL